MSETQQSGEMLFGEIKNHTNLSILAYNTLRDAIINGKIKPGERLLQIDLAKQMGVSQRTVREALAKLEAKGLVVHEPYKGARVTALPLAEIREIYILRSMLEARAIDLAIENMTEEDFAEMEALIPQTSVGSDPDDTFSAQEANRQFHWIVINRSNSKLLIQFLEHLWELMFTYQLLYTETPEIRKAKIKGDLDQHHRYLSALRNHQNDVAKELNSSHIQITIDQLIERFEKDNSINHREESLEKPVSPEKQA